MTQELTPLEELEFALADIEAQIKSEKAQLKESCEIRKAIKSQIDAYITDRKKQLDAAYEQQVYS